MTEENLLGESLKKGNGQKPGRISCPKCNLVLTVDARHCPNCSTPLKNEMARAIPNYEFVKLLGSGGMGHVYQAEHVVLKTKVAIKLLKPDLVETSAFTRFQKEAQATSRLKHPNIIWVYDCGLSLQGEPYMVMDLIEGETLEALLKRGPLPITQALDIGRQICAGMICAHENGILHRDLKPSNIILEKQGGATVAKILDFGIAKIIESSDSVNKTRTGEVFGTPAYMSPEQVSGEPLDQRTDIYSVGCILYEMLTGQPPVLGKSAVDIMYKHVNETPLSLAQASMGQRFPLRLEKLVALSLAKEPSNRFGTMKELMTAIENFQNGKSESFEKNEAKKAAHKPSWKVIALTITGSVACTLAIGGTIFAILHFDDQKPQTKTVEPTIEAVSTPKTSTSEIAVSDSEVFAKANNADFAKQVQRAVHKIDKPPIGITNSALEQLRHKDQLTSIGLQDCTGITSQGLEALVDLPHLVDLSLNGSVLGDKAIPVINKMKHLESLDLIGTDTSDAGLSQLSAALPLRSIELRNTDVGDAGIDSLLRFPNLTRLSVDGCIRVSDSGIARLVKLKLVWLNASRTKLSDASVKTFKKIPTLTGLLLVGTEVSDAGIKSLAQLPHLELLDVRHCPEITLDGVREFVRLAPKCKIKSNFSN